MSNYEFHINQYLNGHMTVFEFTVIGSLVIVYYVGFCGIDMDRMNRDMLNYYNLHMYVTTSRLSYNKSVREQKMRMLQMKVKTRQMPIL
jgi:hypothetical protein